MQGKTEDDKEALYLWLDTGYVNSKGNAIFISLIKQDGYDIEYKGSWVGDYQFLANSICKYNSRHINTINDNRIRFKAKYEKRVSKREKQHIDTFGTVKKKENDSWNII